jgi:hypothetical protein
MAIGRGGVQMLFGSSSLEVLIGVTLLFLVLAVIASAVAEIVAQLLALRSRTLHDAISTMLFSEEARQKVYDHPLIKSLSQQGRVDDFFGRIPRPSYIPSDVFARSLLDVITVRRTDKGALEISAEGLQIPDDLRKLLATLAEPLGPAVNEAGKLAGEVEKWFDDAMDRVSGWYKRKTQLVLIAVGVVIVIWANANVIRYVSVLSTNPDARAAVVAAAQSTTSTPDLDKSLAKLKELDYGIGWEAAATADDSRHLPASIAEIPPAVGANLLGWLFAIAAVSMGAPFWFDVLTRFVNLRGAGAPVDGATDKKKKAERAKGATPP